MKKETREDKVNEIITKRIVEQGEIDLEEVEEKQYNRRCNWFRRWWRVYIYIGRSLNVLTIKI